MVASVAFLDARRAAPPDTPTSELVRRAREGDRRACRLLYERYRSSINRTAARLALAPADADDLVQDAFAGAFDNLHRLREPSSFGEWVRSMVIRAAAKKLRRLRVARRLGLVENSGPPPFLQLSPLTPPEIAVELREVYALLSKLPARMGIALILHRVEGFTHSEIATHLGISEATVKRHIQRALNALSRSPC